MTQFIVLLRGINVNGRSLQMAALRAAAIENGFPDCRTYIQSGNLLLSAQGDAAAAETAIESLIEAHFDMKVIAIARSIADLARMAAANPFPEALPKWLHLCLTKRPISGDVIDRLAERARHGERFALVEGALWIDFAGGVGDSKLTPAVMDKAAGSTLTARNWNTVQTLLAMAAE